MLCTAVIIIKILILLTSKESLIKNDTEHMNHYHVSIAQLLQYQLVQLFLSVVC